MILSTLLLRSAKMGGEQKSLVNFKAELRADVTFSLSMTLANVH